MTSEIGPLLAPLLERGERVLWTGRPHYPNFRSEAWAAFVLGLIVLVAIAVEKLDRPVSQHLSAPQKSSDLGGSIGSRT